MVLQVPSCEHVGCTCRPLNRPCSLVRRALRRVREDGFHDSFMPGQSTAAYSFVVTPNRFHETTTSISQSAEHSLMCCHGMSRAMLLKLLKATDRFRLCPPFWSCRFVCDSPTSDETPSTIVWA